MEEEWRDINGFENYYQVSSLGRVRSVDRTLVLKNGRFHSRRGKILTPVKNKVSGFLQVMLIVHCKMRLMYVHRLTAEAFVENPNPKEYNCVLHKDGNLQNNNVNNLVWAKKNKKLNVI